MVNSPFQIRGGLEGFYGTFYTFPQRNSLIRFLGEHNFNQYIYGPKDDRHHRHRWRDLYPRQHMENFSETVSRARDVGVAFVYAISPGHSISYSSADDFALLKRKLRSFYDIGVRDFSLFLDDIIPKFHDSADGQHYPSYAAAHADLCNRTYFWLQELDPACSLSMCPTDYCGTPPFSSYLQELGQELHRDIDIFYTGPQVCSRQITTADTAAFAEAAGRQPIIWDNYPVNDLAMQLQMHIGPIRGRDATLHSTVRGFAINLMLEPEASKIPLHTFASYFANPEQYRPGEAWQTAVACVVGEESSKWLQLFAENSSRSCLGTSEAAKLEKLTQSALAALEQGASPTSSPPILALDQYLTELSDACYHLRVYIDNRALRQDLLPWIETLHVWKQMGQYSLHVLRALEQNAPLEHLLRRLKELLLEIEWRPQHSTGHALLPLAHHALAQAEAEPVLAVGT